MGEEVSAGLQHFQDLLSNTHANHHTLSFTQATYTLYPDTCSISKSSGCFVTLSSFESVDDEYFFVDKCHSSME